MSRHPSLLEFAGTNPTSEAQEAPRAPGHRSKRIRALWLWMLILAAAPEALLAGASILQTTNGPIPADTSGLMLPHEHIFTDLRGPATPGYGQADIEEVVTVMKPLLLDAKNAGADILVECSSIGVGRNIAALDRLADETGLKIIAPTGIYGRAGFVPAANLSMDVVQLENLFMQELTVGIEGTGIKAGFIKLASDITALSDYQKLVLRAAAKASLRTGAAIASHTTLGARAVEQADFLQGQGISLDRFIWVHAQTEADQNIHLQLAARGVYIEYDSFGTGTPTDPQYITLINAMVTAGFSDRVLVSHDAGWYQPGSVNGGTQRPYTHLMQTFLPNYQTSGASPQLIQLLSVENPRRAFAMPEPVAKSGESWSGYR